MFSMYLITLIIAQPLWHSPMRWIVSSMVTVTVHIYTYKYTCRCVGVCVNIYICVCVCVCVGVWVYICVRVIGVSYRSGSRVRISLSCWTLLQLYCRWIQRSYQNIFINTENHHFIPSVVIFCKSYIWYKYTRMLFKLYSIGINI